jgi:hypothetical protein
MFLYQENIEKLSGRESDSIRTSGAFIWVAQKIRQLLRPRYLQIRAPAKIIYVDILDNDREGALPNQRFCFKRLVLRDVTKLHFLLNAVEGRQSRIMSHQCGAVQKIAFQTVLIRSYDD